MPRSLLFFVAAGLAYLAQMVPMIGIFLMFLLAPLWSVVLVMLRLGLHEAAGPPDERMRNHDYRIAWESVTPASPPQDCKPD